ncbi:MAG TPA: hypothetical protein VMW67_01510 [Desulfobacteria bacterium]|nr:hypothetical protein [Desulfobacteria bacterium]
MSREEEDLVKAIKVLAGTAAVPLKVAADITGDIAKSLENYIPKPSEFASRLIDLRISALQTITNVIEKEISLLETYKKDLETGEEEKKEKVKVE